jgi:hypothetical protein
MNWYGKRGHFSLLPLACRSRLSVKHIQNFMRILIINIIWRGNRLEESL